MPVVFEQAAPMAPDIVAGGGRAEVATRDLPTIAGMYEAANRNQLAASEATARNATQSGIAGAQIANQSSMEADRLGLQRYEFDRSREVSERDNFQANVQAHAAQQHVELQAWLQGQELSQAEQMQLQRDKNALGWVQSNPDFDAQTKLELGTQLMTKINLGNQRQQMAKAKLEQAQTEKILHANAQQTSMENMDAASRSAEFQKRTFTMTNPQTGEEQLFYTDHKGDAAPVPFDGGKKAGKESAPTDENGMTFKDYVDRRHKINLDVEKFIREAEKPVAGDDGKTVTPPKATPEQRQQLRDLFAEESGLPKEWKSAKPQREGSQFDNRPPTTGQPGAAGSAGQPPPQPAPPAPPPTESDLKAMQPFDRMKPESMAPAQKQMMAGYGAMHDEIRLRRDLPEKQRWAAEDAMTDIMAMVERYGSIQRLPPAEKAKYDRAKAIVSKLPPDPNVSTGNANAGLGVGGY